VDFCRRAACPDRSRRSHGKTCRWPTRGSFQLLMNLLMGSKKCQDIPALRRLDMLKASPGVCGRRIIVSMADQGRWTSCWYRYWVLGGQSSARAAGKTAGLPERNFSCGRHLFESHNSPSALRADVYRRPLQEHLNTADSGLKTTGTEEIWSKNN
jgi:hypothetical protein